MNPSHHYSVCRYYYRLEHVIGVVPWRRKLEDWKQNNAPYKRDTKENPANFDLCILGGVDVEPVWFTVVVHCNLNL